MLIFKVSRLPLIETMTIGPCGYPTFPFSFWELSERREKKSPEAFFSLFIFLSHHYGFNESPIKSPWLLSPFWLIGVLGSTSVRAYCCTKPPSPHHNQLPVPCHHYPPISVRLPQKRCLQLIGAIENILYKWGKTNKSGHVSVLNSRRIKIRVVCLFTVYLLKYMSKNTLCQDRQLHSRRDRLRRVIQSSSTKDLDCVHTFQVFIALTQWIP